MGTGVRRGGLQTVPVPRHACVLGTCVWPQQRPPHHGHGSWGQTQVVPCPPPLLPPPSTHPHRLPMARGLLWACLDLSLLTWAVGRSPESQRAAPPLGPSGLCSRPPRPVSPSFGSRGVGTEAQGATPATPAGLPLIRSGSGQGGRCALSVCPLSLGHPHPHSREEELGGGTGEGQTC